MGVAAGLRKHNKRRHRCGMMDRLDRRYRMDPLILLINPILDPSDTSDPTPKEILPINSPSPNQLILRWVASLPQGEILWLIFAYGCGLPGREKHATGD